MNNLKWFLVAGARPNFMKVSPLMRAIKLHNEKHKIQISPFLLHTGQHYDFNMSDSFFKDLNLPEPDVYLGVGSGFHGEQTGKILIEFEKVLMKEKPDLVIVVGDVNSTLACSLASVKLHIPLAHVEAGLRSFDRKMPEEINRLVTDAISDYLFTPSKDGNENLIKEGISEEKIFLVGDIMVDSLFFYLEKAKKTKIIEMIGLKDSKSDKMEISLNRSYNISKLNNESIRPYGLLTVHRPSNVDHKGSFLKIIEALMEISSEIPLIFPIHPRTKKQIKKFGLESYFEFHSSSELKIDDYYHENKLKRKIHCFEPLCYLEFIGLMMHAKVVLTDSGGIQEETTVLNIPCVTLRDTTERPITITKGTNTLVGNDSEKIAFAVNNILKGKTFKRNTSHLWDGHTAERIVKILVNKQTKRMSNQE